MVAETLSASEKPLFFKRYPQSLWTGLVVLLLTASTCLTFALYTGQIWEDFFITFRYSRNLIQGNGLVYTPSEYVHGFTSVINTLLPALFDWLAATPSIMPALWMYRVACIVALAAAACLVVRLIVRERPGDLWAVGVFLALLLLDEKTVAYTINGQEVAFMLLFLALGLRSAYRGFARHWVAMGLAAAGLQYTRPDAFIYVGILSAAGLLFNGQARKAEFIGLIKAAALSAVLYTPWLIFTWGYYGSPIPHTITAKSGAYVQYTAQVQPAPLLRGWMSQTITSANQVFEPIYAGSGGWPWWIGLVGLAAGAISSVYWLTRPRHRLAQIASFSFLLGAAYLGLIGLRSGLVFPWYMPAVAFFGFITLACGLPDWARRCREPESALFVAKGSQVIIALCGAATFFMGLIQIAIQQREIEEGVRMEVGLWLGQHMTPGERVYLEPIGYIGFFSNAKVLDWPGLVSPEVVEARRHGATQATAIPALSPEWLVLRPVEYRRFFRAIPELEQRYELVHAIDANERLDRYDWIPGEGYLRFDAAFLIFRRADQPAGTAPTPEAPQAPDAPQTPQGPQPAPEVQP